MNLGGGSMPQASADPFGLNIKSNNNMGGWDMDEPIIPTLNDTNDPFANLNASKPTTSGMNLNNMAK